MSQNKITSNPGNLQVIYEDNHLIAVNKRVGDIVQGDRTGDTPLSEHIKQYIKEKYAKPGAVFLGVTHRLDRPTTGVVVFARTSKALTRMNKLFAGKETKKIYWAVVGNSPQKDEGVLIHWLKRNPKQNKSYAHISEVAGSKRAELSYRVVRKLDRYTLLEIELMTGRHHQIRAQLSGIGCPIKGDLKYGFPRSNPDGGIHLHARSLGFEHPVKKEWIELEAAPPQDPIWDACL
ncbi:RluA family pseudouridine synthase [Muriicola marianensis]|uniref:RNA pseudouridine synthase n=1 Tax=Muriicola marianensis TaxID=1324801 RepID=A0ABQ1QQ73_9FLAO|nr:RluA family pseudouridine synthase [Muriicola marianensis]GGD37648.1 RNA pseudouridine synthase [Muriicola marianensis]